MNLFFASLAPHLRSLRFNLFLNAKAAKNFAELAKGAHFFNEGFV